MSIIPSLVNAIFTLNKKGEYVLYESPIEGGTTKVSIITKVTQGYRYYKVKQIIAFIDRPTITQDFEINQDFAYKMIERSLYEKITTGEENDTEEIVEVVVTGQSTKLNRDDQPRAKEPTVNSTNVDSGLSSYKPALSSQLAKLEQADSNIPNYNDATFNELNSAVSGGITTDEFSSGGLKIANMSSFTNGSNTTGNGNKANYSSIEDALSGLF